MKKSWRKRKKEVETRTAETNEKYKIADLIENQLVVGVSGKVDEKTHYRTLKDGRIRACKNPKQNVHGESLRNAHKMRDVMAKAQEEYRDEVKRREWERKFKAAVEKGETQAKVLWNYICQQIYREMSVK